MCRLALVVAPHLGSWLELLDVFELFYSLVAQGTGTYSIALQGNECPSQQGRGYISFHASSRKSCTSLFTASYWVRASHRLAQIYGKWA